MVYTIPAILAAVGAGLWVITGPLTGHASRPEWLKPRHAWVVLAFVAALVVAGSLLTQGSGSAPTFAGWYRRAGATCARYRPSVQHAEERVRNVLDASNVTTVLPANVSALTDLRDAYAARTSALLKIPRPTDAKNIDHWLDAENGRDKALTLFAQKMKPVQGMSNFLWRRDRYELDVLEAEGQDFGAKRDAARTEARQLKLPACA